MGRNTTKSNRESEYKATARAERATSGVGAKIGTSEFVQTSPELERARRVGILARGAKRRVERMRRAGNSECEIQNASRRFFEEM